MVAYNKFNIFTKNLVNGVHNFTSDIIKVGLSNSAPSSSNTLWADITEISAGNGYSAGGGTSAMTVSTSSGTAKVVAADVTTTASGAVGPFEYAVVYDATPTSPLKPLICWFDYGSPVTLANGETFTVHFDATNGLFQIT